MEWKRCFKRFFPLFYFKSFSIYKCVQVNHNAQCTMHTQHIPYLSLCHYECVHWFYHRINLKRIVKLIVIGNAFYSNVLKFKADTQQTKMMQRINSNNDASDHDVIVQWMTLPFYLGTVYFFLLNRHWTHKFAYAFKLIRNSWAGLDACL